MVSGAFRIYRGQGSPSISQPARPAPLPRIQRQVLTDPSGYKADPALVDAVNVALLLGQPLLLTGEAGTGKTMLAKSLAWELGYLLEVYETRSTSTATDLFYTYNAPGAVPRGSAVASGAAADAATEAKSPSCAAGERPEPDRGSGFLHYNALGAAIVRACDRAAVADVLPPGFAHPGKPVRSVVLIDEIDKSPRDLPNDVLSALDAMAFTVAELGNARFEADPDPEAGPGADQQLARRALPDPFLRCCIFYQHPTACWARSSSGEIAWARLARDGRAEGPARRRARPVRPTEEFEPALVESGRSTAELLGWLMALRHQDGDRGNPLAQATLADLVRARHAWSRPSKTCPSPRTRSETLGGTSGKGTTFGRARSPNCWSTWLCAVPGRPGIRLPPAWDTGSILAARAARDAGRARQGPRRSERTSGRTSARSFAPRPGSRRTSAAGSTPGSGL